MKEALKQWEEDVSKAYDILAFGHTERAAEILVKTRNSVREALAEQHLQALHDENVRLGLYEQEPVAMWDGHYQIEFGNLSAYKLGQTNWIPLYTTPPQPQSEARGLSQSKPLTDEEIMNIAKVSCIGISPHEDTLNFAKVIEAVHGIKE